MISQIATAQTRIALQHAQVPVPGNSGNQHVRQRCFLIQTTCRLMTQIMKVEVADLRSLENLSIRNGDQRGSSVQGVNRVVTVPEYEEPPSPLTNEVALLRHIVF